MYYILNFNFSCVNYLRNKNDQVNHVTKTYENNLQLNTKSVPHICTFTINLKKFPSISLNQYLSETLDIFLPKILIIQNAL
jgi:hypothetical protein